MIIGVLKEIKLAEKRVCMTPAGVDAMVKHGHQVLVETDAGVGSGFSNEAYKEVGAELVATPKEIFKRADMVMHVKASRPPLLSFVSSPLFPLLSL
ncbi:Alanine dehydrogenase [termite gut metagenome]|uniref:Alanine dehydrogenase n=1 Tax=termite gut metagenome TaxID=433724 RepID=A0A5J4QWZ7_9ZZZZ